MTDPNDTRTVEEQLRAARAILDDVRAVLSAADIATDAPLGYVVGRIVEAAQRAESNAARATASLVAVAAELRKNPPAAPRSRGVQLRVDLDRSTGAPEGEGVMTTYRCWSPTRSEPFESATRVSATTARAAARLYALRTSGPRKIGAKLRVHAAPESESAALGVYAYDLTARADGSFDEAFVDSWHSAAAVEEAEAAAEAQCVTFPPTLATEDADTRLGRAVRAALLARNPADPDWVRRVGRAVVATLQTELDEVRAEFPNVGKPEEEHLVDAIKREEPRR